MGAGTPGRAEGGCTGVGKGWAAWVSVEGEEGGPGGRLEGGGVAGFFFEHGEDFSLELAFVELPAGRNQLSLLRETPRPPGGTGTAPLPCASGWHLWGSGEGGKHGVIFGCLPLPRAPFAFYLSLFASLGACAKAACARRDPGPSCPSAA